MTAITPNTQIRLLHVDLSMDENNQLTFTSETNQRNYFLSLPHDTEIDNCTYMRRDGILRYPKNIDSILKYNYVMYKNDNFSNKWFYAFIEKMEFANPNMTDIKIKTDVYQTWLFEMQLKTCYVEREHVIDDGYYKNLIDEGLPYGDYINDFSFDSIELGSSHPVMGTTVSPIDGTSDVSGGLYNGLYSGCSYYVFEDTNALRNALGRIASSGRSDGITGIFMCPDWLSEFTTLSFSSGIAPIKSSFNAIEKTPIGIPLRPSHLGDYIPKNKKLFNYPYSTYMISNNSGSELNLKFEDFVDDGSHSGDLKIYGCITPGCSIRLIPLHYGNSSDETFTLEENNQYGINMGKLPICNYDVDMYTNWLTQNSVNIGMDIVGSVGSTIIGAGELASGVPTGAGMLGSGINGIVSTMASIHKASLTPDSVRGNTNAGDVTFSSGKLTFTAYHKVIKPQFAKMIDDYFSMYGYKVNNLKVPNTMNRKNWNYVKTIDCNIEGNIPQDDLIELKSLFNKGITLWHKATTFLDYTQDNSNV